MLFCIHMALIYRTIELAGRSLLHQSGWILSFNLKANSSAHAEGAI